MAWLLLEHTRRCMDEQHAVLALRSSDVRSELLGMGYQPGDVSEQTVRGLVRAVVAMAARRR